MFSLSNVEVKVMKDYMEQHLSVVICKQMSKLVVWPLSPWGRKYIYYYQRTNIRY